MNLEKATRIGIDWLTVYNFNIKYTDNYKITEEVNKEYYQERIRIVEPLFMLDTSIRLYETGKLTEYKVLRFNPNRILYGHNIYNSTGEEIEKAIDKLKEMLESKGIQIDLSEAKIKSLEININFEKSFSELKEALQLIFIGCPKLKKISDYEGGEAFKKMFTDGSLQGNWKSYKAIAYDKKKEIDNIGLLNKNLTRLEWQLDSYIYRYYITQLNQDSSLNTLINNFSKIVPYIFVEHTKRKLIKRAFSYIETNLIPNLERGYIRFKNTAKVSRDKGINPERNVYKYLQKNYWIFDYVYLENLVNKYDKRHKGREISRIRKQYIHHNNLEKFNYLVNYILHH
ncbi:MAG: hypothetical protein ACRC6K_00140 [Fusobacteriaceae bacterium]